MTPERTAFGFIRIFRESAIAAGRALGPDAPQEVHRKATAAVARAALAAYEDGKLLSELEARAIIADVLRAELGIAGQRAPATKASAPKGGAA